MSLKTRRELRDPEELIWFPQKGYGTTVPNFIYENTYWNEFREKDKTNVGKVLTKLRRSFVAKITNSPARQDWLHEDGQGFHGDNWGMDLVDIGIGGGAFVENMGCLGYDINPCAVKWLRERLWNKKPIAFMTFWDSLEHMENPYDYLNLCTDLCFISTPIYESAEHCIRSKHYKPGEHVWYFTEPGLTAFMARRGFALLESNRMEETAGRDGIGSYAFQRA